MLDHQVGAGEMAHAQGGLGIIHRVRQVAHQNHVPTVLGHLAKPERPPEHAHIQVNTQRDNVLDLALFEDAPDLLTAVTDQVRFGDNREAVGLCLPEALGLRPIAVSLAAQAACSAGSSSSPPFDWSIGYVPFSSAGIL